MNERISTKEAKEDNKIPIKPETEKGQIKLEIDKAKDKFDEIPEMTVETIVLHEQRQKFFQKLRENGFKHLAWTPGIRDVFYHEEKDILVVNLEGDIKIYTNNTFEDIEKEIQEYPKPEVSLGENYDRRFEKGKEHYKKQKNN
ncbi:MAG: hypothetical protein BTN85_1294 [Candidatus Methanohalarchaeum thermophilum]|uniref:Uncharacterized protein n=1 Tax=Methanohalarchaeum thermophilum TaxID=1903181 RepID=A0A1Q6DWQ1_METT1|nr:MAG: hypothetical protein BTN85_1294 [Candidatus Methanohalarchaeum thermophilum]